MEKSKIIKLWDILENQKCKDCIFCDHCDILSSNYKDDFCGKIHKIIENERED